MNWYAGPFFALIVAVVFLGVAGFRLSGRVDDLEERLAALLDEVV